MQVKEKLQAAKKEKFVFVLVGRTGVGKSSTVNTLMGQSIAEVGDWEPTTMEVKSYDSNAFGVSFTVIDTPGLCDDLEEKGNDAVYLNLIRSKAQKFDCLWFVSRLDETRVTSDEKRGIKLIGEAFGEQVWKHTIIVFTWANSVNPDKFKLAVEKRTELIRNEIAKYTDKNISLDVPSVPVDNTSKTTPDGEEWLGALYTTVFSKISSKGVLPFYIATASRVSTPNQNQEIHSSTPSTQGPSIKLNEEQTKIVKKRIDAELILGTTIAGAAIGSVFGPAGAAIGGVIGAGVGLIAWLWN